MLRVKPAFSLSSFTFIKRLLNSSSLSAIKVVSSAYLRLLIFLPVILIPTCASSLSHSIIFLYFFALITEEGFLISPCYSLELCSQMGRRRQWQPTPVLLPGKSHGWRSLVGCSPWGREELGTTERLHFHFSLSCVGEGNGNLLRSRILAWRIPGTAEPGGLPSMGLHRVEHN